jgi:hypothetical protein
MQAASEARVENVEKVQGLSVGAFIAGRSPWGRLGRGLRREWVGALAVLRLLRQALRRAKWLRRGLGLEWLRLRKAWGANRGNRGRRRPSRRHRCGGESG